MNNTYKKFPDYGFVVVQLDLTKKTAESFAVAWFVLERDADKWMSDNAVILAQVVTAADYNAIVTQAVAA
jgi:hypothetical protein